MNTEKLTYLVCTINVYAIWYCFLFVCLFIFLNGLLCCDPAIPEVHGWPFIDFNYS